MNNDLKSELEEFWNKYIDYKKNPEKDKLDIISYYDSILNTAYNYLNEDWNDNNAYILLYGMKNVIFKKLNI